MKLLLQGGADPNVQDSLSFSRSGALQWKTVDEIDRLVKHKEIFYTRSTESV